MRVRTRISADYPEMEIHVCNYEMNERVKEVVMRIERTVNDTIAGTDENGIRLLPVCEIARFYACNQKVLAQHKDGSYSVHSKLYELEEQLDEKQFVRISKSEIVNIRKIKKLDMDMAGTIRIVLSDGTQTYTSRRCIPRLKKALGI